MIHKFKIKNFLSFKDEITFNFEATKDKNLEEHHVVEVKPGVRILKLGIVYGANASGKSNLVNAFYFLHHFWLNSTESKDDKTGVVPFLLDDTSRKEPSEFTLTFYVRGNKHVYSLKLTESKVVSENLYYYPGTQPSRIFSRQFDQNVSKIEFNKKLKISYAAKDEIVVKCLPNMSLFAAYFKVNIHFDEIDSVITWMKTHFMEAVEPGTLSLEKYTESLILRDSSVKENILKFLSEADFNISNITTTIEEKPVSEDFLDLLIRSDIPVEEKERLKKDRTIRIFKTLFRHKVYDKNGKEAFFELPDKYQSNGTLRTMGIAGFIEQAIKQDAFIAIDEIDSSIHPRLVEFLIEYFLKRSKFSQLLITTHYDGLLEERDLIRKDNIWLTSKEKDGSTELYSLADFKGVNRISSLQKAYKYGKFGAVPNI